MKYKIISIFVLVSALFSCYNNEDDEINTKINVYKNHYVDLRLKWYEMDQIGVFSGSIENSLFLNISDTLLAGALFEGEKINGSCLAYYPYSPETFLDGGKISFVIFKEQMFVANDAIAANINPSVSISTADRSFIFHNIGSILSVRLTGVGELKSIDFVVEGQIISGNGMYNINSNEPIMNSSDLQSDMVSLIDISQSLTSEVNVFNIVIPAGVYPSCKLVVHGSNGELAEYALLEGVEVSCGRTFKLDPIEVSFLIE